MSGERDRRAPSGADATGDPWHEETIPIRTRETPEAPDVSSVGRIEAPSTETPDFSEMTVPMRPAFAPPSTPSAPDAPSMPGAPSAPSLPSAPSMPSGPSAPSAPSAPSGPDLGALGGGAAGAVGALVPGAAGVIGAVQTAVAVGQLVAAGVSAIASALDSGPALPKVRFTFWPTQDSDAEWKVRAMSRREELSGLYRLVLDLACEELSIDPHAMHGKPASLILERDVAAHRVAGIVSVVETQGHAAGHQLVRVHVVPALDALRYRVNSRIFQDMTVPEIVEQVMSEGLARFQRSVDASQLCRAYPAREYCVQQRESDLDFCLRLLAEEGISFFFDQSDEAERVVLTDRNEAFPAFETMDGQPIRIAPEGADLEVESIRTFDGVATTGSSSAVLSDHDWTQPDLDLAKESRGEAPGGWDHEHFEYPGPLTLHRYDDGAHRYAANDGAEKVRLFREMLASRSVVFHVSADVVGLAPGRTFALCGSVDPSLDRKYLVVAIDAEGAAPEVIITDQDGVTGDRERFRVRFECIPLTVPFRPARRPRPQIAGHQRARVVGPAGEEIHTDHHGRIKVQFPWDREGQRNERSSCWIRVLQPWGGAGWGHVFIPRIGMEVVVSFEDGDPDRPLVIGCVHNGANPSPYTLPSDKTRSVLRTATTPGGPSAGHNELSFEDAAGNEEVYLRAQKNLREEVLHDHATTVGNDQSNAVTGNRSTTVSGSHSEGVSGGQGISVGGERNVSVTGNQTHTLSAKRTTSVTSDDRLAIGGTRTLEVTGKTTETHRASRSAKVTGTEEVLVDGNRVDVVNTIWHASARVEYRLAAGLCLTEMRGGTNEMSAPGRIHATVAGVAELDIKSSGWAGIVAASGVVLECGASRIELTPGEIKIISPVVKIASRGGSFVKVGALGVKANGGVVDIQGGIIKLNEG